MKKNNLLTESFFAFVLVVLAALLIDPFNAWMPNTLHMLLLTLMVAAFAVFSALVWKESPKDERESFHRMYAGRLAFLAGAGILVLGIIVQGLQHTVDPWLVGALGGMLLAKFFGIAYSRKYH